MIWYLKFKKPNKCEPPEKINQAQRLNRKLHPYFNPKRLCMTAAECIKRLFKQATYYKCKISLMRQD